jgi:hypothetical protein
MLGVYRNDAAGSRQHTRAAAPAMATITGLNKEKDRANLYVESLERTVTIDVLDTSIYQPGQRVPVLVDRSGGKPWVRLVAEPDDPTTWAPLALLAFLLAGAVLLRRAQVRWARGRPLSRGASAVAVIVRAVNSRIGDSRRIALFAFDGSGPPMAVLTILGIAAAAGYLPRDTIPFPSAERVYVTGQFGTSGVVRVVSLDGRHVFEAILRSATLLQQTGRAR